MFIEKIAFGNIANLGRKSQKYNIKFQRTDKPIDIDGLRESNLFPEIFGTEEREGLLEKKDYRLISNSDGTLTIEYPKRQRENKETQEMAQEGKQEFQIAEENFRKEIAKDAPSLERQSEFSREVMEHYRSEGQQSNDRNTDLSK